MADREGKGFLKGTLIGALVGSVVALLVAPKSGKETRADLKREAKNVWGDIEQKLNWLNRELIRRIDELKSAAKDLQGEAREESQGLIKRAEVLKRDLQAAAGNLAKGGGKVKDDAVTDAKRLVAEGSEVLSELERLTRKLVGSAKDKVQARNSKSEAPNSNGEE